MHPLGEFIPKNRRRILLVFPAYARSFGTFDHAFPLIDVRAFMPPQGILLIASLLPKEWEIKFIDENIQPTWPEEFDWADAIFISGMHIQRSNILDLNERAHKAGKLTILGGPSVSAAPEFYPSVDILHCGEAGDATLRLLQHLDQTTARPASQLIFRTADRMDLAEFPSPAYHLAQLKDYMLGSIQFSSGCPFTCEFCDIPSLYGRNPRLKTPQQILKELDYLREGGLDAVYFVDDNFIANPKAALEMLPHLVQWQKKHSYPIRFSCEATLNISTHPKILELMRESLFVTMFCGIETPEPVALRAMKKSQNLRTPILESVKTLNRYGIEVVSGIILGLDTDTPETPQAIIDFATESQIPLMTVNILYALPHTPLHTRLQKAGRLVDDQKRDSNIIFLDGYEVVVERWQRVISHIYDPRNLYTRFATQARETYPNRHQPRLSWNKLRWRTLKRALQIFSRLIFNVGIRSHYRREFWKMFWQLASRGKIYAIEALFHVAVVAHHLIMYARECVDGKMQSSNYSTRSLDARYRLESPIAANSRRASS